MNTTEKIKKISKKTQDRIKEDLINYKYILNQIKQVIDFQDALVDPLYAQKRILRKILKRNKDTEYGIKYNFKYIKKIEDYQKYVPIIKWKDIDSDVDRIKNGTQNILTKDKVVYFASTSGTTNKIKLVPITKQRIKNHNKVIALWTIYGFKDRINALNGKLLYFAGPYQEGKTKGKIPYGSISGYLPFKSPWWLKIKLTPKIRTFNEFNFNKKLKKIAIQALQENVTQIGFTTPIEAILFFDYIKDHKNTLIKIIKRKNSDKAERLELLKEFKPCNIWPNVVLISCFKSKTNEMYINTLLEKFGKEVTVIDPGINASEGRISIGLGKSDSGVPPINMSFFEYIDVDKENAKPITINKLKKNKKYKVIMTTQEGLYRYDIGDVIKVTGFMKKIPLIRFYNRDNFLNIAGELAPEKELVTIMEKTIKECKLNIKHFTIIPCIETSKKPRYEILLDIKDKVSDKIIKEFQKKIDINLQKNINDYMQMRNEFGRMDKPVISILKNGSYDKFNSKRIVSSGNPKPINIHKDKEFKNNFEIEKTIR